jgi:hypothetical protein
VGSDCGDINTDVDDGRSELELSPADKSGKLLTYRKEWIENTITYLIKLFF